jgi:hypothetical protein
MRFVSRAIRARIGFSPSKIQKCANGRYWTADLLPKQAMVLENEKNPCFGDLDKAKTLIAESYDKM